ncbi:MAG: hypothetical protein C4324_04540 [Blastocatellia bacterium]
MKFVMANQEIRNAAKMRKLIIVAIIAFSIAGCGKPSESPANVSSNAKRYPVRGKVISVDRANKKATIAHEEIPGFMEAMTMDFPIHEDWVWDDLVPGAEIQAELVLDNAAKDPYWLERIAILANSSRAGLESEVKPPAQIGQLVPAVPLINQDGKKFTLRDFRNKAVAVTFIYRECPLPEFCIKMSRQFSDMANRIAADPVAKEKIRLVSISFDPQRDTPEKLRQYGLGYLGKDAKDDFTVWRLAVGSESDIRKIADFFGLKYEKDANEKTQFNHSLVTAVIGPDGKVRAIHPGGRWTPDGVLAELKSAAGLDKTN